MRALPAGSFEYFGETAVGKVAVAPEPTPVVVGVLPPLGTAALALAAGVLAGVADAVGPHSALRNSLHVFPCSVPADCAALYLVLHSLIVIAFAAEEAAMSSSATASIVAHDISERVGMRLSLDISMEYARQAVRVPWSKDSLLAADSSVRLPVQSRPNQKAG
jgi:hypothetical protein